MAHDSPRPLLSVLFSWLRSLLQPLTEPGMTHLPDCSPRRPGRAAGEPGDRRSRDTPPEGPHQLTDTDAYVQSWLRQIESHRYNHPPKPPDLQSVLDAAWPPWRPHRIPLPGPSPARQAVPSPSLFVRDSPLPSVSSDREGSVDVLLDAPSSSRRKKQRHASPSESSLSAYGAPDDVFCKRPRRKTRDDRYDTTKHRDRHETAAKKKSARSRKRSDRKMQALRSGREVINNFASDAVSNQRITMKPNLTTGLFLNGRTSTPAQPADLTFYDLDIVARSRARNERKGLSKSKPRRQQRAKRELQEESNFFADVTFQEKQDPSPSSPGKRPPAVVVIGPGAFDTLSVQCSDHGRPANRAASPNSKAEGGVEARVPQARDLSTAATPISWASSNHSRCVCPRTLGRDVTSRDSHINELLETGVYDHTEISRHCIALSHADQQTRQASSTKDAGCAVSLPSSVKVKPIYEDKGFMVSPWPDSQGVLSAPSPAAAPPMRNSLDGKVSGSDEAIQDSRRVCGQRLGDSPRPNARVRDDVAESLSAWCQNAQRAEASGSLDLLLRQRETSRTAAHGTIGGSGREQQAVGGQTQTFPVHNSPRAFGGHTWFSFPNNLPSVQPLRHGVPAPQELCRPRTSPGTRQSPGAPMTLQAQAWVSNVDGRCDSQMGRTRSAALVDDETGETLQEFIARLEHEVLYGAETENWPGQDSGQFDAGDLVDNPEVDSPLRGLRHGVDERDYFHGATTGSAETGGDLDRLGDQHAAARSGTPPLGQRKAPRPRQHAHDAEDIDMVGFWRPNCLM